MHDVRAAAGRGGTLGGGTLGRVLAAGLAAGTAAVTVVSCASSAAPVALPNKHAVLHLADAPPARQSPRQLVVAAYEGYWRATSLAVDSRSAVRARKILSWYIPSSAVPTLVNGLSQLWQRDEITYGSPVFHIMSVKLTGPGSAAVHDCIDLSHAGFADKRTGQIVGGLGQPHDYLITTLAYEHGRWLVTGAIPVVRPCAY